MSIKFIFFFLLLVFSPFAILGWMPHWYFWEYELKVNMYRGGCEVKLTPVLFSGLKLEGVHRVIKTKKLNSKISNQYGDMNYKFISKCEEESGGIKVGFTYFADEDSSGSLMVKSFSGGYFIPRTMNAIRYLDDFLVLNDVALVCGKDTLINATKEKRGINGKGNVFLEDGLTHSLDINLSATCVARKSSALF